MDSYILVDNLKFALQLAIAEAEKNAPGSAFLEALKNNLKCLHSGGQLIIRYDY